MAFFSQDKTLLETYQNNWDIHAMVAERIGCSRAISKWISFWLNYWRTAYWLAFWLWISVEDAEKFIWEYWVQFPWVKAFMDKAKNTVKVQKFVQTITKRRRRFKNYNKLPIKSGGKQYSEMDYDEKRRINRA